ncbi:hypothetical protein SAMN04487996_11182 [Dyadobacter soli]|uniref:Uncharacterized protein n=1 Tax=Dyadobacter soli TaxID=659014 RepID=A0A1G7LUR8_9BACT|nr:hypothetical protein [Dyadobacter soli]SDF53114.1 hypothetical protein SAMN04487996_11182 [Dyadobacter soli]
MNTFEEQQFPFPGRWLGGISLVLAPVLLLAGELLKFRFDFFFPAQLSAYQSHPTLMFTAYSLFLAGNMLLWPAIITLANLIGRTKPMWAVWGGSLVLFGLFARTFHSGINHLAFQLVNTLGLPKATEVVAQSYGAFHIVSTLSGAILFGWAVLAVGAWLSGTLPPWGVVALAMMSALMIGVLKGGTVMSVIATGCACVALLPLGIRVLMHGSMPPARIFWGWLIFSSAVIGLFFFLGQAG